MAGRSSSPVAALLYRNLARLAKQHDNDPALKALLGFSPSQEYSWDEQKWVSLEGVDPRRGLHALGTAFMDGCSYKPQRSLLAFVREQFRSDSEASTGNCER